MDIDLDDAGIGCDADDVDAFVVRRGIAFDMNGQSERRGRAFRRSDEIEILFDTDGRWHEDAEPSVARLDGNGGAHMAADLVREHNDRRFSDVNYIIPAFILGYLPIGLVGLLILAIIMAATDTIAGELNSLSTATVIDFYKRHFRPTASDAHYLTVSKAVTGLWGLFACAVAVWAVELGSLIEVVNRFGSFFYGSILGVFVLAIAFRPATGNGAFIGLIAGMASVAWFASFTTVAFLWHNVIGAVVVVIVGVAVSAIDPWRSRREAP